MQIVIDIHEKDYQSILNGCHVSYHVVYAIMNGTPLPKGHGKIIDESQITEVYVQTTEERYLKGQFIVPRHNIVGTDAPTIIPADSEE